MSSTGKLDAALPAGSREGESPGFLRRRDRPGILYVIQYEDYSGAELMHVPVMQMDADPLLACPPGSRTEELARSLGIPTAPLPFRSLRRSAGLLDTIRSVFRGLASARDLRRVLKEHPEREVIFCTAVRPALVAALASLGLGRKLLWNIPEWMPPAPLRQAVRMLAWLSCDRALAHSESVKGSFVRGSRRLRSRTTVMYPGTQVERFEGLGAVAGRPRAAIVGHISGRKRIDLAIEIAGRVGAAEPEFELVIVGRAQFRRSNLELEKALKDRVAGDPRLSPHVRFAGYTGDVGGVLAECGLLLHCRPNEPFGIVLIEAMAAGLPVVAPAAAGPAEIVEDGVTGLLYEPGNAEQAAGCVVRLVQDAEAARRMGAAGREAVRRRFSTEAQLAATEQALAGLLGGCPDARGRPAPRQAS